MGRIIENNKVDVAGEIVNDFEYDHEFCGEKFYRAKLKVYRFSGNYDVLPILVSDRLIDVLSDWIGIFVEIKGQFRSFNKKLESGTKLILSIFAQEIKQLECVSYSDNHIELDGYICKETIFRETLLKKEIADLLVAINRPYGKTDYIPCICWGRNAIFADGLEVGTRIKLEGRIQSRNYTKHISETETETRTAYEVSVSKLEVVED